MGVPRVLKELPLFRKAQSNRPDIHIRLVSMDMDTDPNPDKVRRFVARKRLTSEVIILDIYTNPNKWIDQVEKKWSGALPTTLIINNQNGKRVFVERRLHAGELETDLRSKSINISFMKRIIFSVLMVFALVA